MAEDHIGRGRVGEAWQMAVVGPEVVPIVVTSILAAALIGLAYTLVRRRRLLDEQIRRQTDQLKESESFQRGIIEGLPAGVVVIDPQSRQIERVNALAAALFGAPVPEIVSHRCHAYLCPALEGACPVCDLGREVDNTEREMLRADGSRVSILKSVKRIQLGGREKLLECFVNISDRKQMEAALRESEANFRAFFESMTDLILVATPAGRLLFTNAAVTRTLGYSPEELTRMSALEVHPVDKRAEAAETLAALLCGERKAGWVPLVHKDGSLVPAETRAWSGRWNGADCTFSVAKNLTAEVEAQQRFEGLFRSNPALMALSTLPDHRFVDVNHAFLHTLGFSREEILGRTAADVGLFVQPEQTARIAEQLAASGRIADFELQVRRKNGTVLDGLFSGELVVSQGRRHFLTVMIDLSARKRAEEQLRATLSELERLNRVMMNREQRVLELKKEINQLRFAAGQAAAYPSAVDCTTTKPD